MIFILLIQLLISLFVIVFVSFAKHKITYYNSSKLIESNLFALSLINFFITLFLGTFFNFFNQEMDIFATLGILFYAGLFSFVSALVIPYFGYEFILRLEIQLRSKLIFALLLGFLTSIISCLPIVLFNSGLIIYAGLFCLAGSISTPLVLYMAK